MDMGLLASQWVFAHTVFASDGEDPWTLRERRSLRFVCRVRSPWPQSEVGATAGADLSHLPCLPEATLIQEAVKGSWQGSMSAGDDEPINSTQPTTSIYEDS